MTNMTQAQAELLARAGAEPRGVIYAPEDEKIARALTVKNLAISLQIVGGGDRLIITVSGCRALLARRGAAEAATAKGKPDPTETRGEGVVAQSQGEPPAADVAASDVPAPAASAAKTPIEEPGPRGKLGVLVNLLARPEGAGVEDMMTATGWQAHSVRGAISGALKKKHGLAIVRERTETERVHRLPASR
jgi:hypothetical protein